MSNGYITDYCVAPVNDIKARLAEGFQPYGFPLIAQKNGGGEDSIAFYQALIKTEPSSLDSIIADKASHPLFSHFSAIEKQCIKGVMADLRYEEIAKKVHRSPRTVSDIIRKLRQQYDCKTNAGLIFNLYHYLCSIN